MRKICYITGTRAEFGLLYRTLSRLNDHPEIDLSILITAMHLLPEYGYTVGEIEKSSFRVCASVPVELSGGTGGEMVRAIGHEIIGITEILENEAPDIVLLLGDRGESLAAALVAVHLNIPIVHLHGGERSGTVDEMVRHAISKFAHYHFVATEGSRERLIKMGELEENVFVTGAPSLDGLDEFKNIPKRTLFKTFGFDVNRPLALMVFHPVVQQIDSLEQQVKATMDALLSLSTQVFVLTPNADAGGMKIQKALKSYENHVDVQIQVHLERDEYLFLLAAVDVMVGNSSSGIIEAASFGLGVVNIGSRQNLRERNANVIDVPVDKTQIQAAVSSILSQGKKEWDNIWGDGHASDRILDLLLTLSLSQKLLEKCNSY